jgi:uncharacterized protein YbjT (DUF2867 family)
MKVIVFGATGTIGRLFVERGLADGHQVTAFARNPHRLEVKHPKLRLVTGDALNENDVAQAIAGHDAVVVTLGAGASRKSTIRSQGTRNIIAGMKANGVRRLICQSTLGTHESRPNLNFWWRRVMFGLILRPVYLDHQLQENLVRDSGLDWTIVRPSAFTDAAVPGKLREGFGPAEQGLNLKITRLEVADFLRRQLNEHRYWGKAVAISH